MKSSRLALSLVVLSVLLLGLNATPAAFADEANADGDAPVSSDAPAAGDSADSSASAPSAGSDDSAPSSGTADSSPPPGAADGDPSAGTADNSPSAGAADSDSSAGSADNTSSAGAAEAGKPSSEEARAAAMNALKQDAKLDARAALVTMTPFKSDKGISFQYPKSWNIEVPTEGPTFFRAKTMKGIVNFNAILDQMPEGMTLDDYVKMTVEMTPKALADQKLEIGPLETVEQKSIDIGKLSGTKLVINYEFKDIKLKVKTTQVFALTKKGTLYILCFSMPENTYDEYTSLIQQVLDSVKFS